MISKSVYYDRVRDRKPYVSDLKRDALQKEIAAATANSTSVVLENQTTAHGPAPDDPGVAQQNSAANGDAGQLGISAKAAKEKDAERYLGYLQAT